MARRGVGLVGGQDPELVDTIDETISLAYRQVIWFLDVKVGVVEREGDKTICWVWWPCHNYVAMELKNHQAHWY